MANKRMTLVETVSRSDAPIILGATVNTLVMRAYEYRTSPWREYVNVGEVPDFRDVDYINIYTEDQLDRIIEGEPYPEGRFREEAAPRFRVHKYGKMLKITYEMIIDDNLRMIRSLAENYGRLAESGEARMAVNLLESIPVGDDLDGNPLAGPLNEDLMSRALNAFYYGQEQRGRILQLSPSMCIAHGRYADVLRTVFRPSTVYDFNPLAGRVRVLEEPYLTDHNFFYLIADPNINPAIEIDFLNSPFDSREDYRNGPRVIPDSLNTTSVLPGDIGVAGEGFRYDSLGFKVRHVYGGAVVDDRVVLKVEIT